MRAKPKQSIMMQMVRVRTINGEVEAEPTGRRLNTPFGVCEYYRLKNGKVILYGTTGKEDSEKRGVHDR